MVKNEKKKDMESFLDTIFPRLDPNEYEFRVVKGRIYDINEERVLSFRDKDFYACIEEFSSPYSIKPFIDYLISNEPLATEWNFGGYGEYKFTARDGRNVTLLGNHGITDIIAGIRDGRWDPSDVLHDLAFFNIVAGTDPKDERLSFRDEVRDMIKNGFTVTVLVKKQPKSKNGS